MKSLDFACTSNIGNTVISVCVVGGEQEAKGDRGICSKERTIIIEMEYPPSKHTSMASGKRFIWAQGCVPSV